MCLGLTLQNAHTNQSVHDTKSGSRCCPCWTYADLCGCGVLGWMFLVPFQHLQCLSFWIKDLKAELKQPGHPKRLKLLDLFPGSSADLVAFFRCPVSNPMLQTAIDANSFDQTENIQFLERLSRHHSV